MSFINGFTTLSYKEFGDNGYFVTLKKLLQEKFLGLVNIKHNNFNNSQQCEALQKCEGFFFIKFLFRADMLAQHRLLKIVKGEKNLNVCQKSVNFQQFYTVL